MRYPWGNAITHNDANFHGMGGRDRWKYNAPVGSFSRNSYGLYNMAGNVWEWCADWYHRDYYAQSPSQNPKGPHSGRSRVIRGGSWDHSPKGLRVANRCGLSPAERYADVGFRCAKDVIPP
jgi:formylglycine-generating enzyme